MVRDWRLLKVTPGPNPVPDRADFFTYERVVPSAVGGPQPKVLRLSNYIQYLTSI